MKKRLFISLLMAILLLHSAAAALPWQFVNPGAGEIAEIAISPSNPSIMYVGMENNAHALYKSVDGGKTWKHISGPGDHAKDVAVSPKDPHKAYVAMSESVHTTDLSITPTSKSMFDRPGQRHGETQTVLSSGVSPGPSERSFSSFEIFEQDDTIIYATLKGGSYGPVNFGGGIRPLLYKSTDRGATWNTREMDVDEINVLAIDPQNHNLLYLGTGDGIFASRDSGKTLEKLHQTNRPVISLEIAVQQQLIIAATEDEVWKSSDAGNTWEEITGKLEDIHRVRPAGSNPTIVYASTFQGVFRSDDGGESWKDVSHDLPKNIQIVTVHPANPDIAFVGTSSLWSAVRAEGGYRQGLLAHQGIYVTKDGGKTWHKSDDGIFEYNFEEIAVNPSKPYEAWYAGVASRGALKTEDAGQHWRQAQLPTLHYPMRIKFSAQNPRKVLATGWQSGGPFALSEDGGVSWMLASHEPFHRGVSRGKHLLTSASRDGGSIHLHGAAFDPQDDTIIYVGSVADAFNPQNFPLEGAHIFVSRDDGETWEESDTGFPHEAETAIHDIAIDPQNTNIIYVATTHHEAKVGKGIYTSADKGKTWKAANNGLGESTSVSTIIVHPTDGNNVLAATEKGLYLSSNAGASWKQTKNTPAFDVEYVEEEPDMVYASTNDGVFKSDDFGQTWSPENSGLPAGEGQGIGVDPTGKVVYAAVRDNGLYVARMVAVPEQDLPSEWSSRGHGGGVPAGSSFFGRDDDEQNRRAPEGERESRGSIMPEVTGDFCEGITWPPSCSWVPDETRRQLCERCKNQPRDESEEQRREPGEKLPGEEQPAESPLPEKKRLLEKVIGFFKKVFGISKKPGQQEKIQRTEPLEADYTSSADGRQPQPEQPRVDPTGRTFNPALSCVGHCTGYAESGKDWCFCDAVCEKNGNCCADFKTACHLPLPSETNPTPLAQEQVIPPDPAGLLRQYPDFVKCSWVTPPGLPQVVENLNELKQLGLNSVCIIQGVRKFDPSTTNELWGSMKLTTLSSIATLKRSGFAIVIFLDAGGGPQAQKEYTKLTMQQFLDVVEEEALAWAKLAEEYQVEYFAPANELPSKLHNLLAEYSESERQRKKIEKANEWHKYMLPKVREVFKGKVIAKLGDYSTGLDTQEYDVIAYTIGHDFSLELEEFRRNKVQEVYKVSISQVAAENAEWWVGELYFAYEEAFNPNAPQEYTTLSKQLRELQDDYHRIIIEEISALPPEKRPKGLVVGGYGPGSTIPQLTDSSREIIQNFFLSSGG